MPCYFPLSAWRSKIINESGKRNLVFKEQDAWQADPDGRLEIPCGQCVGCRLERSRQWAMRIMHESTLYIENSYLTLTYDPDKLPENGTLVKKHFQDFMKRLRKKYLGRKIRYFHCGEYGDNFRRPHYHAILFNLDFEDKKFLKNFNGNKLYKSETLEKLWSHGFCTIGAVTFESAAYVARYCLKKVTGINAKKEDEIGLTHYQDLNLTTGEIVDLVPEYVTMSRRPGIGKPWLDKYHTDIFPNDYCVVNGKKVGVPKFYENILSDAELKKLKKERKYTALKHADNNTSDRLAVREEIAKAKLNLKKRSFEDD